MDDDELSAQAESEYWDYEGEPIGRDEWASLFEDPKRIIAQEWVLARDRKRLYISTVWLGLDHNWARQTGEYLALMDEEGVLEKIDLRPWIFETMVFGNEPPWWSVFAHPDYLDIYQERSATWAEAERAHTRAVALARSGEL